MSRESVIPENADDEIWLKLYVFRNVQINVIGDAYHCDPSTTLYSYFTYTYSWSNIFSLKRWFKF